MQLFSKTLNFADFSGIFFATARRPSQVLLLSSTVRVYNTKNQIPLRYPASEPAGSGAGLRHARELLASWRAQWSLAYHALSCSLAAR